MHELKYDRKMILGCHLQAGCHPDLSSKNAFSKTAPTEKQIITTVSDPTMLLPEQPLDGEWDENGKAFSGEGAGGPESTHTDGATDDEEEKRSRLLKEARHEALNDAQRPLDR